MKLTSRSETDQELVFSQPGQNTEERTEGLSYATGSASQENLVTLKSFSRFLNKLHLSLTLLIASRKPLILRNFVLYLRFRRFNASVGATGSHDSSG